VGFLEVLIMWRNTSMKMSAYVTSLWSVLDGAQEFVCRLQYHFHSLGFKNVCVTLYVLRTYSLLVHWYLLACVIFQANLQGRKPCTWNLCGVLKPESWTHDCIEVSVMTFQRLYTVERLSCARIFFSSGRLNLARSLSGVWHGRIDNIKWWCFVSKH